MRLSIPEGKIRIKLDDSLITSIADWTVFFLLLLSTLGIVLPSPLKPMVSLLAYPATLLLFLYRWKQIIYVLTRDPTYLLLLILAIASITWSAAPSQTIAIVRSLINTSMLVGYIAASYSPREQIRLWSKIFLTWGILSLVVELIWPGYTQFALGGGNHSFWQGIFGFKLGLGSSMALGSVLAIYAVFRAKQRKWLPVVCLLCGLVLIVQSESKTSLLAFVAVLLLFPLFLMGQQRNFKLRTANYLLIFLLSAVVIGFAVLNFEMIVVDWLGKDLTFTGRSTLWSAIIHQGLKRPWFGYGHGAFWFTENSLDAAFMNDWPALPASGEYFESFHSHSGYIELFLNLGFVGVSVFALNYILVWKRAVSLFFALRREEFFWMIQILVFVSIINYSEVGSFLIGRNLLWILYSTTVLSSAIAKENYRFRLASPAGV